MAIHINGHWKEMIEYIGLEEKHLTLLNNYQSYIESKTQQVIVRFYNRMAAVPKLAEIAETNSTFQRLVQTQVDYFKHLFTDTIDDAYIHYVTRIGAAHARIGLEPDWYMGGVTVYLDEMMALCSDLEDGLPLYHAFTKRLLFDTKIALLAYDRLKENHEYKDKIIIHSNEMLHNLTLLSEVAATHSSESTNLNQTYASNAKEIDFLAQELLRIAQELHEEAQ
ncbi:protoglobin domain-containing protein [Bacillus tianshenii]|nr:protoglobin domain-containing protein [Bacillus tianshenii]